MNVESALDFEEARQIIFDLCITKKKKTHPQKSPNHLLGFK